MGLALCIAFFSGALVLGQLRLAHGLGFVVAVGCAYGMLRCWFLDGFSHFCFDAALLGLYLAILPRIRFGATDRRLDIKTWVALLALFPVFIVLMSPFLDSQPLLVQLVGLRNAVLFVPALLIGALLDQDEMGVLAGWFEWIVFAVSVVASVEWIWGIEPFFPYNSASQIIYISRDVGEGFFRIPATFSSAHAYGTTMVVMVPFLVYRLTSVRRGRLLAVLALVFASLGVFVCGARSPVILLLLVLGGVLLSLRTRVAGLMLVGLACVTVVFLVNQSSRLRRYETLYDAEFLEERISASVSLSFVEIIEEHPAGKGLGSAAGTSIPYFLADISRPQIGIENEYSRVTLEQGVLGLILWLIFIIWALARLPWRLLRFGGAADLGLWLACVGLWSTAAIGTGTMASVPASLLLTLAMGAIAGQRPSPALVRRTPPRGTPRARLAHAE